MGYRRLHLRMIAPVVHTPARRAGRRLGNRVFGVLAAASLCACGVGQTIECAEYVECAEHYAGVFSIEPADTSPYEEGGRCWADAQLADQCSDQCIEAREGLGHALRISGEPEGPCA